MLEIRIPRLKKTCDKGLTLSKNIGSGMAHPNSSIPELIILLTVKFALSNLPSVIEISCPYFIPVSQNQRRFFQVLFEILVQSLSPVWYILDIFYICPSDWCLVKASDVLARDTAYYR